MAWLPSALGRNAVSSNCLVCSQKVPASAQGSSEKGLEVIKVICHLLHVNWRVLAQWTEGQYPLCHSCGSVVRDLASIWAELQLIEKELRSKVREIEVIVQGQVGRRRRSRSPNPLQRHLIEECRVRELMQAKVAEGHNVTQMVPSVVQLHLDLRRSDIGPLPDCHSENYKNQRSRNQRLRRKKLRSLEEEERILPDAEEESFAVKLEAEDAVDQVATQNGGDGSSSIPQNGGDGSSAPQNGGDGSSAPQNGGDGSSAPQNGGDGSSAPQNGDDDDSDYVPTENGSDFEPPSDEDVKDVLSGDESGEEPRSSKRGKFVDPVSGKRSMVAMREPWKAEKQEDGNLLFRGIQIKRKGVGPGERGKYKFGLECGSCGKEMFQRVKGQPGLRSCHSEMKMHIAVMHLGLARCDLCQKNFSSPKALQGHLSSLLHYRRNPTESLKVAEPSLERKGVSVSEGRLFFNGIEMVRSEVEGGFDLSCSQCSHVVSWEEAKGRRRDSCTLLINHIKVEHAGIYNCRLCHKKYADPRNLENHFIYKHTLNPPKIHCSICQRPLRHSFSLKKHLWTHKNEEEFAAAVAAGERPPVTYRKYMEQRREKLGSTKNFQCTECGKVFELLCALKRHEKTHNPKRYECAGCDSVFPTPGLRLAHAQEVHKCKKKGRVIYCALCPEFFKSREAYKEHEQQHNAELPHSCDFCSEGFALQRSLTNHLRKCPLKTLKGHNGQSEGDEPRVKRRRSKGQEVIDPVPAVLEEIEIESLQVDLMDPCS